MKYIISCAVIILFNTSIHSQSLIKAIEGDLYVEKMEHENLVSQMHLKNSLINYQLDNNVKYLFSTRDDTLIVRAHDQLFILTADDYPNGFVLADIVSTPKEEKSASTTLIDIANNILASSFDNKNQYDKLYITSGMGITRDLFSTTSSNSDTSLNSFVLADQFISLNDTNNVYTLTEKCVLSNSNERIKNNSNIFISSLCDTLLFVNTEGEKFLAIQRPLSEDLQNQYDKLLNNIENNNEKLISEFILVNMLITENYILNAQYLLNQFNSNDLIFSFLDTIRNY